MVFSPTTVTGTAVLEYGPAEILPPVGAISKHVRVSADLVATRARAHPRGKPGFSTFEGGCGRETDSLLEGAGFEPSVPREENHALQTAAWTVTVFPFGRTLAGHLL
jgi:hypothetical protein